MAVNGIMIVLFHISAGITILLAYDIIRNRKS